MNRPLVVGVGNTLRSDDGIGPLVVKKLEQSQEAWFDSLCVEGDPLELLDLWQDRALVVVVDIYEAQGSELEIKEWCFEGQAEPLPFVTGGFSTHFFGLPETIELGRSLDRLPKKMLLLALPGSHFVVGEKPGPRAEALVDQAVLRVQDYLRTNGDSKCMNQE